LTFDALALGFGAAFGQLCIGRRGVDGGIDACLQLLPAFGYSTATENQAARQKEKSDGFALSGNVWFHIYLLIEW
jgi:hypothetical protein